MERPTTGLHLPVSGFDVDVITYFTEGEDGEVQRYGLEGAEATVAIDDKTGEEQMVIKNIPVDRDRRELRKMMEFGVVSARNDGEAIPVGEDFIRNLPRQDTEVLADHLLKVRSGDGLPKAASSASP